VLTGSKSERARRPRVQLIFFSEGAFGWPHKKITKAHDLLVFFRPQVTVATQTGHESPDLAFNPDKMTTDGHCYECKVRYKDPKPQDLVMYLHAWKYKVSDGSKIESEKIT
jgi:hypothetical protein